ncbi:MAG: metallophosphoesterase, partial [Dehalococcoidia bacterium]|nr:metallophosphoesterase [Dehalococcoidia bacterium]
MSAPWIFTIVILIICIITVVYTLATTERKRRWKHRPPQTFFIADTHFDNRREAHKSPFKRTWLMNKILRDNWNRKVSMRDKVYVLGDFIDSKRVTYWKNRLNGRIEFIAGNHDPH